ncbi:MAG: oxygen-independent coproporphyrinogen III oxidase [Lachnospiraceae bacterium]|nr:oxygen-independent coproporphyrinogen III oxidase [Lachnospiraceae bacterium]
MPSKELELYLHIPFCVRKCDYCDFLSMPADEDLRRHYVDCLIEEIKQKAALCSEYRVTSVFFGGGTPSILPGVQIWELMEALQRNFKICEDAEVTVECNPGTLTRQKLIYYKMAGVNRLSIGLQSANNQELQRLGRIHTYEEFLDSFGQARAMGFKNINVDLMSALPGQKQEDWIDTLNKVLAVRPEHISAYSLMVEEGTPFYDQYGEDERRREQGELPLYLPSEEMEREMYLITQELLRNKGYVRYEISNYTFPGRECRHNIGYWKLTPYLGLGLGSSSFLEEVRFSNTKNLKTYLSGENFSQEDCVYVFLDKRQRMEEFMFLGLRMMEGISRSVFQQMFGIKLEAVYGNVLEQLQQQGLLKQQEGRVALTEAGISVSNYVLSEFLLL